MNQLKLPKLRKVGSDYKKKQKLLLLGDDIRFQSGISTISRELVIGSVDKYDWVQLGCAIKHPDHGKRINLSESIATESGVPDASMLIYAHAGYGNPDVLREIISYEKPDAIVFITDPRFWGWLFMMEHELRSEYKIPLIYINIWDSYITPLWNAGSYASCDMLYSINKGTKVINSECLRYHNTKFTDLDKLPLTDVLNRVDPNSTNESWVDFDKNADLGVLLKYLPHGSSVKYFYKQTEHSIDWKEFSEFKSNLLNNHKIDFCIFYNSRNIRRKQPGDVILAYKLFCDKLPKEQSKRCCLIMKTHVQDEHGTDLMAVKKAICPKYKVLFNQESVPTNALNWFYNVADVTMFMSSAEGFGLAANESLLCGTPIIAPVTGGLQDQMRFTDENGKWIEFTLDFTTNSRGKYKNHGSWAFPVFPRARQLQGSIPTPYIFDDVCDAEDAADQLFKVYSLTKEDRENRGLEGRDWVLSEESGMSSVSMCSDFKNGLDVLFKVYKPKKRYELIKSETPIDMGDMGIELWKN